MLGGLISGITNALGLGDKERPGYQSPYQGLRQNYVQAIRPIADSDINWYRDFGQGMRRTATTNAYNALDPSRNYSFAQAIGDRMRRNGTSLGNVAARRAQSQGYGTGVQEGLRLDASNQANVSANDALLSLLNPQQFAGQYQAQAGLVNPAETLSTLSLLLSLAGSADQAGMAEFQTRRTEPGILSNLLGAASSVIPFMGAPQRAPQQSPYMRWDGGGYL